MTECERLVANGTFRPEFFREEVRCGFLVEERRKKIWAVLLDLLREFDRVCRENGLTYFLFVGSLLGAIRHHGIIPWDDDVDVIMPRADYEKMMTLAKAFHDPYFLQTPATDPGYCLGFSKLRNSRTSCVSEVFRFARFNQGLLLDFHPLDAWIPEEGEDAFRKIQELMYCNSTYMRIGNPNLSEEDQKRVKAYPGGDPMARCRLARELGLSFADRDTPYVCRNTFGIYGYRRNIFLREDFSAAKMVDFEGFRFPVPVGYDRILTTLYGNYMQLPPPEKRGTWHLGEIVDPDRPFTHYLGTR